MNNLAAHSQVLTSLTYTVNSKWFQFTEKLGTGSPDFQEIGDGGPQFYVTPVHKLCQKGS